MAKPSLFETEQGDEPGLPPEPTRLRKVPGRAMDADLKIITDAISLKRATVAPRTLVDEGAVLTEICQDWLREQSTIPIEHTVALRNIVTRYRAQHDRILWPQNRPCDCEICQEAEKIINAVKGKP